MSELSFWRHQGAFLLKYQRFTGLLAVLSALALTQCTPETEVDVPRKCNLYENLCEKTVPEVAFATTHNAMSNKADGWGGYNHFYGIPDQLQEGYRGFMLDIYEDEGVLKLCHGSCIAGAIDFETVMDTYHEFMTENPHEVIVFIFETHIEPERFADAFDSHPLGELAFEINPWDEWPTLNTLIDTNQRLIMLSDTVENAPSYILDMWAHAVDVHYAAESQADFNCEFFRGEPENQLFIFNHFISDPLPNETAAAEVNAYDVLMPRIEQCQRKNGRFPNFVTVDFFSLGDTLQVVKELNGN
ncbi:MAG: hypothetical protein CMH56_01285 [Myxococcales bacterium]|nr:hypothetical protein [Myxococcales bacterium]|tara:strand:- start:147 stop:1049 length:903 start_codon:yes stop_codon:yes gene_type:complete